LSVFNYCDNDEVVTKFNGHQPKHTWFEHISLGSIAASTINYATMVKFEFISKYSI